MDVLKNILSESKDYYDDIHEKIEKRLSQLPAGSIKERKISGKKYYYLQKRVGKKVMHNYLGKKKPESMINQIKERNRLKKELKKVKEAQKILKRAKGKKHA